MKQKYWQTMIVKTACGLVWIAIASTLQISANAFAQENSSNNTEQSQPTPEVSPSTTESTSAAQQTETVDNSAELPGVCVDLSDDNPACRAIDAAFDHLNEELTRIEAERAARRAVIEQAAQEAIRQAAIAARRPTRPSARPAPAPGQNQTQPQTPGRADELPEVSPGAVSPVTPEHGATINEGPHGAVTMNFSDEHVIGSTYRIDNPSAFASNRNSALSCFDTHVAPVFDSLHQARATESIQATETPPSTTVTSETVTPPSAPVSSPTEIAAADRRRLLLGYRDMLRCFYPCLTPEDAQFLMDCTDVRRLIRSINETTEVGSLMEADPLKGCTVDELLAGFTAGQFTASKLINGSCQPLGTGELQQVVRNEYDLFKGLDIAVLFDNSQSMSMLGPQFAQMIFPEFVRATRQLSQEARVILFSQNLGFAGATVTQYSPLVRSTRDRTYQRVARDYVNHLYRQDGDGSERHTMAALEVLTPNLRRDSDLLLIIVTDEDDGVAPIPPEQFIGALNALTSGRINIAAVTNGGERSLETNFPNFANLLHHPGIRGVSVDLEDVAPNGDIQTKIVNQLQNLVNPDLTQWYPLQLREAVLGIDHVEVNGQLLAPSAYRLASPNRIEFAPGTFNAQVATRVVVHSLRPDTRPVDVVRRAWMATFIDGLNSSRMDPANQAPYTTFENIYRTRYQERLNRAHANEQAAQSIVTAFRQQQPARLSAQNFADVLTQWNQSNKLDLSKAFSMFTNQDRNRLRAAAGRLWSPILSWLNYEFPPISGFQNIASPPRPPARTQRGATTAAEITPPRTRCMAQIRQTENSFGSALSERRTAMPAVTKFFEALEELMAQKISMRIIECDGLVDPTATPAAGATTSPGAPAAPTQTMLLEQMLQRIGGQSQTEQSLRATPPPATLPEIEPGTSPLQ